MTKHAILERLGTSTVEEPTGYTLEYYGLQDFMRSFARFTDELFPETVKTETQDLPSDGLINISLTGVSYFLKILVTSVIASPQIDARIWIDRKCVRFSVNYKSASFDIEKLARLAAESGLLIDKSEEGFIEFIVPIVTSKVHKLYAIEIKSFENVLYHVFFT